MQGNRILKIFFVLLALVFIIHQAYSSFYKPVTTESAEFYTAVDGIDVTGIIIRNETVISSDAGGVLHFVTADGSRVAKDGIIASIYDTEGASLTVSQIDAVKKQIADIEEIQKYNNLEAADLDLINSKVKSGLNELVRNTVGNNFSNVSQDGDNLLSYINRRQVATGVTTDFSAQLAALNTQLSTLNASLPNARGAIYANESGYFVSTVDGYENVLKCDNLEALTPEFMASAEPEQVPDNAIGKIVSDYEWYIAAKVSINDSLKYKEGDSLTVKTSVKSCPRLPVIVKKINISSDSSDAVIILSCDEMNSEIASMRSGPMTVVSAEYSGLRVPKSALRVIDSKTGVYVVTGMQIKFVTVNVIYSDNSYIVCEQQTSTDTVLRLYDDVVVKGRNLYDGKIVS